MTDTRTIETTQTKLNLVDLKKLIKDADIPGIAVAYIDSSGKISSLVSSTTDKHTTSSLADVTPATIFNAASLSKPVFAYLVLKLVEQDRFKLDKSFAELLDEKNIDVKAILKTHSLKDNAAAFTAEMVLTHQTGIPRQLG